MFFRAIPFLRAALAFAGASALAFTACSQNGSDVPPIPEGAVQYHAHVRPILEARCVGCHSSGGIAPFSMAYDATEWASGAPPWVKSALDAVEQGTMPPWLPAADCRELAYERKLGDDEKTLLTEWAKQGFVEGDARTYGGPRIVDAPAPLGAPTFEVKPSVAYAPSADRTDDYRCFVLPQEFSEETYLTASAVVPGNTQIVHHALLFLIPPANQPAIEKLEAKDPEPGYTCYGGPGGGSLTTLGAWVPGSVTIPTAPGSALVIPKGSKIVLQMHYNTLALDGAKPPAEQSTVQLWTSTTKPDSRIELLPLAHLNLDIQAHDPKSEQERVFNMPVDGTIVSLAPHMHVLGERLEATLETGTPGAEASACLVDIPAWDFHWQQTYALPDATKLPVKKGDRLKVRCTYDNSAENQPLIDGKKKLSSEVSWGEGTLDEMCLLFVGIRVPFEQPDFRCGAFAGCYTSCPAGDAQCFFDCATVGGGQCGDCMVRAVGQCALPYCAKVGLALKDCTSTCTENGTACLTQTCGSEFKTFYECMEPHVRNGDCKEPIGACGE